MDEMYNRHLGECNLCHDYFGILDLEFTYKGGYVYCERCREAEVIAYDQKEYEDQY